MDQERSTVLRSGLWSHLHSLTVLRPNKMVRPFNDIAGPHIRQEVHPNRGKCLLTSGHHMVLILFRHSLPNLLLTSRLVLHLQKQTEQHHFYWYLCGSECVFCLSHDQTVVGVCTSSLHFSGYWVELVV